MTFCQMGIQDEILVGFETKYDIYICWEISAISYMP